MATISRLNTSISDHTALTQTIAVCLIAAGVIVFAFNNRSDVLPKSYDALQPSQTTPSQVSQAPTSNDLTIAKPVSTTLNVANSSQHSLQNQPQDEVSQLQPAQDTNYNSKATVNYVQPAANGVQLTGANPQDAATSLQ